MRSPGLLACLWLLLAAPAPAWCFGSEGHRVVGYVAEALLTPKTALRVHRLTGGATLDQVSTFMDDFKAALGPRIRKWHFDNAPVCDDTPVQAYCRAVDCASAQITRLAAVVADESADPVARREAAVFLTHLVADIHQPLHAADNGDRGARR